MSLSKPSPHLYSEGEKRHFRIMSMIKEEGQQVLKLVLIKILAGSTLAERLAEAAVKAQLDDALDRKQIQKDQYESFYPPSGAIQTDTFDVTLLVFLIRQLHPSMKMSNKLWINPPHENLRPEADVTRLKVRRNKLAHSGRTTLTENEFEVEFQELEMILCRLVRYASSLDLTVADIVQTLNNKKHALFEGRPESSHVATSTSSSLEKVPACISDTDSVCSLPSTENAGYCVPSIGLKKEATTSTSSLEKKRKLSGTPDIEAVDMVSFLLRQLHPFLKPSNQILTKPEVSDTSVDADITRLRDIRNRVQQSVTMSETEFEEVYRHMETVLCRLNESAGGTKRDSEEILVRNRLKRKKNGSFETKPDQADISTSVSDSLDKTVKNGDDKMKSSSIFQMDQDIKHINENSTRRRRSSLGAFYLFRSCCKNVEPRTVLTNDHSSLQNRCSVTSIAVLQEGTVVVTDTIHDVVQAFTSSGQPLQEFKCNKPNSVCAVNFNSVAVALGEDRTVLILTVDFQSRIITSKKDYNVNCTSQIIGIKYHTGFLYVLCEMGEVHTININTGAEQALYKTNVLCPSYFDLSPDGNSIYISKGHTIYCIWLPGNIIHTYVDKYGRALKGITLGKEKVYASVWNRRVILKLNRDLTLVKEIYIDNLHNPMALCNHRCHLYISNYSTDLGWYKCREIVVVKK